MGALAGPLALLNAIGACKEVTLGLRAHRPFHISLVAATFKVTASIALDHVTCLASASCHI